MKSLSNLNGKVIVITGGAGLIGQTFVQAVVKEGATAIIADINDDIGKSVQRELQTSLESTNIDYVHLDMTSDMSLASAIKTIDEKYGRIDALVNNAYPRNKQYGRSFFDVEYSDFVENVGLNVGGYFLASQQFAKYFERQTYGNIINISSIYGVIAPKFDIYEDTNMTMPVEYAAIKSALIHLTKYMAQYFKGMNIRVNAISPGGIYDAQPEVFLKKYAQYTLNKGMLDKKDLEGTLVYLLSDMSQYVQGQNIIVDDGFCL